MSIHFYPDLNGYVGEPDQPGTTPAEDADAAASVAYAAADALALELDRHDGDAGDDADALLSIAARLTALRDEARALMGRKRRMIRDAHGLPLGLVTMRDPCRAGLWDIVPEQTCPECGALPDTKCGRIA